MPVMLSDGNGLVVMGPIPNSEIGVMVPGLWMSVEETRRLRDALTAAIKAAESQRATPTPTPTEEDKHEVA